MGLTIQYSLVSQAERPEDARALLEKLRDRACDLPFAEVGEIVEFQSEPECRPSYFDIGDEHQWLKIQAARFVDCEVDGVAIGKQVGPEYLIAFTIFPGDGCEPANFGLCLYPKTIMARGKQVKTNISGWRLRSFCKTQYASNPDCGGLPNFLRCHVGLVKLLDYARELDLLAEVSDESGYWENRDVPALLKEIGKWNQMIAGLVGTMKDTLGKLGEPTQTLVSEITKFPNFEHLEAEGRKE